MHIRLLKAAYVAMAAALIGLTAPLAAEEPQPLDARFLAFAHHNIDQIPDSQIYVGPPNVVTVADWTRAAAIEAHLTLLATAGFAEGPIGPDIVLIHRRADDPEAAFAAFSTILRDMGLDPVETERLWSSSTSAPTCTPIYARDYLAILSVNDKEQAVACASAALYRFRGVPVSFATYALAKASDATAAADEMLAGIVAGCAKLGWMEESVRACIFGHIVKIPGFQPPPAKRR